MDEQYDEELRRRLKKYSEVPADRLWNSLTARMEEEDRAHRLQKKTRKGWIFLLAVVMISGFYTMVDSVSDESSFLAKTGLEKKSEGQVPQDDQINTKTTLPLPSPVDINSRMASGSSLNSGFEKRKGTLARADATEEFPSHASNEIQIVSVENSDPSFAQIAIDDHPAVSKEPNGSVNYDSVAVASEPGNKKTESQSDHENKEKKEKKKLPFNIYFTIMPTLGYQRIEPNSNDNLIIESIDKVAAFSPDRLGVRAELGVEHPITNRINVFGGFVYFQRHQTIGYTESQIIGSEISMGPNGEINSDPEYEYFPRSFDYEVRNLGLQIGANFQLSKKKFLHTLGTGVEFHVALNKVQPSAQTSEFTNNPSVYIFYNFYYRLQYPADTKLRAVMQPTLNYSFYIEQNANAPFYVKPYGLGLNIGFTYNF